MNYLRGFFSFYGRINRLQYAIVMLIGYLGSLAIFALTWPSLRAMGDLGVFTGLASLIVGIWVLFAAMAKRFHDINKSGLSSLLILLPVAGLFTPLALLFYRGEATDNRFGRPPLWF
jgi:uncharacterized membrane protein YhaH (DUF805 family)